MKKLFLERFIRNKYFLGKLLTVKDFEIEQNYILQKRRLLNQLLWGFGIVKGLEIEIENRRNVTIRSGIAIDALGNELILTDSVTVNLSTLVGFNSCKLSDRCYLCIKYDEFEREQVPALSHEPMVKNKEYYNRIVEGYALVLIKDQMSVESQNVVCLGALSLTAVEDSYDINDFEYDPLKHRVYKTVHTGRVHMTLNGQTSFSEEICHGLGDDPVAIDTAIEVSVNGDAVVLSGNLELFEGYKHLSNDLKYDIGVIQYCDKGLFRIAVKPKSPKKQEIVIKWWAYRNSDEIEIVKATR